MAGYSTVVSNTAPFMAAVASMPLFAAVFAGFYPDPSITRRGNDFRIAST